MYVETTISSRGACADVTARASFCPPSRATFESSSLFLLRVQNKEPLAVSLLQLQTKAKGANVVLRDHCRDSDKRLDALFITHNRMLPLLHKLDYVIGIDATYEMCQHDLKLLQIVLLLPWGNPLPAAFALMEHEDDETYMWVFAQFKYLLKQPMIPAVVAMDNCRAARNALEAVWPTSKLILCHWHATQNIMKEASTLIAENSLKAFKRDWQSMLHAEFEGEADELWIEFAAKYGEGDEGDAAVSYVSRCWRSPEQWDHIANCITKRIKHYSIRTTSIVEAAHSSLKASMPKTAQRRKLNIEEMLDFVIDWQLRVLRSAGHELTDQRKTLNWQRQGSLYRNILTLISQEALEIIKGQAEEAQQALAKDRDHTVSYAAHRLCTADLAKPHDLPELDWTDYPSDSCITHSALGLPCEHRFALYFDLHGQDYELTEKDIDAFHFLPESLESLGEQEVAHHPPPYVQAGIDFQHALQDASNGALGSLPHDHASRIIRCARTYAKNIWQKQEGESDADDESDASDAPSLSAGPSQAFFTNPITPEKYLRKRSKAESKKLLKRKKTSAEKSMKQLATKAWLQGRLCGKCKSPGHQRHQCQKSKEDQMKGYARWEQAMADKRENEKSQRKETKKAARERQQAEREARKAARKAQRREEGLSSDTHTSDEEPTPPPAEVDDPAARLAKEAEDLQAAPRPPRLMIRGVTTPPPGEDPNFYYAADDPGPPTEADFTFDSAPSGREKTPTSSAKDNAQVAAQVAAPTTPTNASFAAGKRTLKPVDQIDPNGPEGQALLRTLLDAAYASPSAATSTAPRQVDSAALAQSPSKVAAATALVDLQEGRKGPKWTPKPPVLLPKDISLAVFTTLIVKRELPALGNGNCGYNALKEMLKMRGSAAVRNMVLDTMNSAVGREALPDLLEEEWKRWKAKVYPNGVIPADNGRRLQGWAPKSLWFTNWLSPVVVNRTGRLIIIGSVSSVTGWSTFLPASKADLSRPPEPPMGLMFKPGDDDKDEGHWDGFEVNENQPLPPVELGLWGGKAKEYCSRETHQYFHHYYQFYTRGDPGENDRCPCFWTKSTSEAVRISSQIEIQEISDGEDSEIVVSSVDLPTGKRTTRARMPVIKKAKEDEKKAEKAPVIKAEPVSPPRGKPKATVPQTPLRATRSVAAAAEAAKKAKEEEEKVEKSTLR